MTTSPEKEGQAAGRGLPKDMSQRSVPWGPVPARGGEGSSHLNRKGQQALAPTLQVEEWPGG